MTLRLVGDRGREECDLSFTAAVIDKSRSDLERCYQCLACSSGCPVAYIMDDAPHRLIRMALLGLKDRVMDSNTYWLCSSCHTCATRCPNEIDIVRFMDTLRQMAVREGRTRQTGLPLFHATFLDSVKKRGRAHELGMVLAYTLKSGGLFRLKQLSKDFGLAARMLLKGKFSLLPVRTKGAADVKRIFRSAGS